MTKRPGTSRHHPIFLAGFLFALLLTACAGPQKPGNDNHPRVEACPAPGTWVSRESPEPLGTSQLLNRYDDARIILLGEHHDRAEDHRWQLHVLAALHGRHSNLVVGFEMFPRRHQDVLDAWIGGTMDEDTLLRRTDWFETWGHASELYMPLFQFVRMHRIPTYALNVDREVVSRVGRDGWEAVPAPDREGVGPAVQPPDSYVREMRELLEYHPVPDGMTPDEFLEQFIRAQSVWDRAMAEKLAQALADHGGPVVGIVGRGHAEYGHGIPHQLGDLGVDDVVVLLPHRNGQRCLDEEPLIADALFGVADSPSDTRVSAPRLGIAVSANDHGLAITDVARNSPGGRAGLRQDDVIVRAAGQALRTRGDLLALLDRQRSGNLLPLEVLRNGEATDIMVEL